MYDRDASVVAASASDAAYERSLWRLDEWPLRPPTPDARALEGTILEGIVPAPSSSPDPPTDVVGRDPEIDGRPLDLWNLAKAFLNVQGIKGESAKLWMHAWKGELSPGEKTFVPPSERHAVFAKARLWLAVYALVLAASLAMRSPLPSMFVFLPYTLGAWHFVLVGVFQHASLEHDVLDHRLNTRSCLINPVSAFIYW